MMAPIHKATAGPVVSDLVTAVLEEFDQWADHAARQAASLNPTDVEAAARSALMDMRAELMDHVQIRLSIALATHGISS